MLGGRHRCREDILLQTLVTSLLLANRPDELNLVLVDFKGGSAFLPFENCPHVVSLSGPPADDPRRQSSTRRPRPGSSRRSAPRCATAGSHSWPGTAARSTSIGRAPAARACRRCHDWYMIFDEFARVLDVSPDFLQELVNVAAKGRSLGMHLVLATQSTAGKLSAGDEEQHRPAHHAAAERAARTASRCSASRTRSASPAGSSGRG